MKKDTKTLMTLSQNESEKVLEKLKNAKKVEYKENYTLYLVDRALMQELIRMKEEFGKKLKEAGILPPRKNPYYYVAKLINPKLSDRAVDFTITEIKRYIYVKDKGSILKNIDKEFEIWKNTQYKLLKEACKEQSEEFCAKLKKELDERVEYAYYEKEKIKKNLDNLDVLWTSYKVAKHYPTVAYKRVDKDHYNEHLRKGIPNILLYEPKENRLKKRDNEVEEFIKEAKNPFGFFYYKEKR